MYIRHPAPLYRLCERAKTEGVIAFDVEFIREQTYVPQVALIQIALGDTFAIIDPLEIDDLSPLLEVVHSPEIIKILHAAGQDLEVLLWNVGRPPARIFDTQIAAAIGGLGEQLSYSHLVESVLGVSLAKAETYSNWLQRPLSPEQMAYALDDVRYLPTLYNVLSTRLMDMGRMVWAEEECRKFERLELYQRNPRTLFRRIRRGRQLSSRGLAILRELADWRDAEARQRDCPPGSVLRDEILVEIARKAPQSQGALLQLRGLPRRELDRSGAALVDVVKCGLAVSDEECPRSERRLRLTRTEELMVKFLATYMKALCHRKSLPASSVASRADLEQFVYHYRQGWLASKVSPLLKGWRGALIGQELLAVLDGRVSVYVDPETGRIENMPRRSF
jgi:ribonuclease D